MGSSDVEIHLHLIGLRGDENARNANCPAGLIELEVESPGVSAGVGGIIPGSLVHQGPIQKLAPGIVAVGVAVEKVVQTEFSRDQSDPGSIDTSSTLVLVRRDFLLFSTQAKNLLDVDPRKIELGLRIVDSVDLSIGEGGDTCRTA